MKTFKDAEKDALNIFEDKNWVMWVHDENVPKKHCAECLILNKRYFLESKLPKNKVTNSEKREGREDGLLHPNCHCELVPIPQPIAGVTAIGESDLSKFDKYIFLDNEKSKGKFKMFYDWGYDIMDSESLREEFIRQGQEKYASGNYKIGKIDKMYQRISIRITIPRKDKLGIVSFITGWVLEKGGKIRLVTPYGGK